MEALGQLCELKRSFRPHPAIPPIVESSAYLWVSDVGLDGVICSIYISSSFFPSFYGLPNY